MNILNTRTDCDGDHPCRQTWSALQDLALRMLYKR